MPFFDPLPGRPTPDQWMWRVVLGGENQGQVKVGAGISSRQHLLHTEVFDSHDADGMGNVAEKWPRQFIAGRPCSKHIRIRITCFEKTRGILVQLDVVAV